jgi:hypothetical protein
VFLVDLGGENSLRFVLPHPQLTKDRAPGATPQPAQSSGPNISTFDVETLAALDHRFSRRRRWLSIRQTLWRVPPLGTFPATELVCALGRQPIAVVATANPAYRRNQARPVSLPVPRCSEATLFEGPEMGKDTGRDGRWSREVLQGSSPNVANRLLEAMLTVGYSGHREVRLQRGQEQ